MPEHSRYTQGDLIRIAHDKGPFFRDNACQALMWCARVLEAADSAVQAERERAERAEKQLRDFRLSHSNQQTGGARCQTKNK